MRKVRGMNDFTKEELKKIKLSLSYEYDRDGLVSTANLKSRIQSMIDNYCEHEWSRKPSGLMTCKNCELVYQE